MSTKKDAVIRYLTFYFKILFDKAGIIWNESNDADIEYLVDMIINASKEVQK